MAGDGTAEGPSDGQKIGCLGVILVLLAIGFVINLVNGDDEPDQPAGELITCPEILEVAGPYRQGIDPEYDARMDWDGDGVSCES